MVTRQTIKKAFENWTKEERQILGKILTHLFKGQRLQYDDKKNYVYLGEHWKWDYSLLGTTKAGDKLDSNFFLNLIRSQKCEQVKGMYTQEDVHKEISSVYHPSREHIYLQLFDTGGYQRVQDDATELLELLLQ